MTSLTWQQFKYEHLLNISQNVGLNETIYEVLKSFLNGKPNDFLQLIDFKKNLFKATWAHHTMLS
jgi:hypothetical protein